VTTKEVLSRLRRVRQSRKGWTSLCPAHDDRSPSLSVCDSNEKTLLHCFAGCTTEAVCAALSIETRDLFDSPRNFLKPEPDIVRHARRQIVGLRSHLTTTDRERAVVVVLAGRKNPDVAIARALALTVEGEITQLVLDKDEL
jgi:hypothetical protein